VSEEAKAPEATPEEEKQEPQPPNWEFKKEFAINKRMREVAHLTISAAESELVLLRRKLEKLHYGS
jgi:hypothetical protein